MDCPTEPGTDRNLRDTWWDAGCLIASYRDSAAGEKLEVTLTANAPVTRGRGSCRPGEVLTVNHRRYNTAGAILSCALSVRATEKEVRHRRRMGSYAVGVLPCTVV